MVCADGVAPSCAGKRTDRLSLPSARAATVRVVLGFVPKAVFVTLTPTGGTGHDIRLPARRSLRVRVPADFTGTLTVFAPARQGGDAAYGICLERASAR